MEMESRVPDFANDLHDLFQDDAMDSKNNKTGEQDDGHESDASLEDETAVDPNWNTTHNTGEVTDAALDEDATFMTEPPASDKATVVTAEPNTLDDGDYIKPAITDVNGSLDEMEVHDDSDEIEMPAGFGDEEDVPSEEEQQQEVSNKEQDSEVTADGVSSNIASAENEQDVEMSTMGDHEADTRIEKGHEDNIHSDERAAEDQVSDDVHEEMPNGSEHEENVTVDNGHENKVSSEEKDENGFHDGDGHINEVPAEVTHETKLTEESGHENKTPTEDVQDNKVSAEDEVENVMPAADTDEIEESAAEEDMNEEYAENEVDEKPAPRKNSKFIRFLSKYPSNRDLSDLPESPEKPVRAKSAPPSKPAKIVRTESAPPPAPAAPVINRTKVERPRSALSRSRPSTSTSTVNRPSQETKERTVSSSQQKDSKPANARPSSALRKTQFANPVASEAMNRLYNDAKESEKRKELMRAEMDSECTFAPKLNRRRATPYPTRSQLATQEAAGKSRRRSVSKQTDFSFKPKITSRGNNSKATGSGPRYESLYKDASEQQQKRESRSRRMQEQDGCTFKPHISDRAMHTKSKPLYDADYVKQKKLQREQQKLESEMKECSFKPHVSARKAATGGDKTLSIYDRLYQSSKQKQEKLNKMRHDREEQEKSATTFRPKVSKYPTKKEGGKKESVYDRLYMKDYRQSVAAQREQKKLEEEKKAHTFKPELRKSELWQPKEVVEEPNKGSIFERLYGEKEKVKEKIVIGEELRLQKELKDCTFRPQIDVPSTLKKQLEDNTPVWDRLLTYDKGQVVAEREKRKEEMELEECTFRPNIKPKDKEISVSFALDGQRENCEDSVAKYRSLRRTKSERAPNNTVSKRSSMPDRRAIKDIIRDSNVVLSIPEGSSAGSLLSRSLPNSINSSDLKSARRQSATSSPLLKESSSSVPKQMYSQLYRHHSVSAMDNIRPGGKEKQGKATSAVMDLESSIRKKLFQMNDDSAAAIEAEAEGEFL